MISNSKSFSYLSLIQFTWVKYIDRWTGSNSVHRIISRIRASFPFLSLFSLVLVEPLLLFLFCQHVVWIHPDRQAFHISKVTRLQMATWGILRPWPAVLTVAPGLAVNVAVTPAPADVLGRSVVLQTSSEENECILLICWHNYLKNIGRDSIEELEDILEEL